MKVNEMKQVHQIFAQNQEAFKRNTNDFIPFGFEELQTAEQEDKLEQLIEMMYAKHH